MNLLDLYISIGELHEYLHKILDQEDVNFDVLFKNHAYNFESVFIPEDRAAQERKRRELVHALLLDHTNDIVNHICLSPETPWTPRNLVVEVLLHHGERPQGATLEIVSDEYDVEKDTEKESGREWLKKNILQD